MSNLLHSINFFSNNQYYHSKSYDEIIPNLYIGNIDGARKLSFLKDKKIKVIINCTKQLPNYYEDVKYNIEYYRVPVDDSLLDEDIDLMKILLPKYVNIIDNALENNKPVFVHCYAGRQRSACIIAAYLIFKYNLTINEAYKLIISKRDESFHYGNSFNFHKSLIEFNNSIGNNRI
jgi:protein-tyrosine phosphatase